MSSREWRFRIEDMLSAILAIQKYTEGMTFDQFLNDAKIVAHRFTMLFSCGEILKDSSPHGTNSL